MLEKILELEKGLFFLINSSHSPFWDQVMWMYSGIYIWLPYIFFFCFMLIYKKKKQEWMPVLISLICVSILCVVFSSLITKPLFARPRPIFHPSFMEEVRTLYENIVEPYGFVSGHSATTFGIAIFTSLLFKNKLYTCVIFIWALLMAYSRIYLGVHFVSDIVGGGLAGVIIGYLIYLLYSSYISKYISKEKGNEAIYSYSRSKILALTLFAYMLLFMIIVSVFQRFII